MLGLILAGNILLANELSSQNFCRAMAEFKLRQCNIRFKDQTASAVEPLSTGISPLLCGVLEKQRARASEQFSCAD